MEFNIDKQPEFSWLKVNVPVGKKLFVESAAMATMSVNMKMKALFKGGLRRFISGESLFLTEFTSEGVDGEVSIAPGPSGDIGHYKLTGQKFYLASSSYLAHTEGVEYSTKFQKLSAGILSGAGWFLIEVFGQGDVWFNSYGAIVELDVNGELMIDNGHLVGFTEGVEYDIVRLGGYKSLFFSGEGFVCKFRGQGKVYFQTKKPASLIAWANMFRPVQRNNS
jgi:uncharacterized protein (TIGR00266 family)